MTSSEIRKTFLQFFQDKQHQIVASAPLVIKNDPTLLFTNAGMNQFKDLFLGSGVVEFKRIADTQKCLRVSGKHNDLEEVGIDTYHHTFFEMLGNWSFGDYFKKEAIAWAWELLTVVYKLPVKDLYVTIFEGDAELALEKDVESFGFWEEFIATDRIIDGNRKDNFWEMGDTGPCGPCSEIHIDLRTEAEKAAVSGRSLVNQGHPQVVEIWNLVFMQFNRLSSGKLINLPARHVDTGMGFERLCMAIQKKRSNYDTDVFQPMIRFMAEKREVEYEKNETIDIALRVLADHVRAISFSIADGQLPSNTGAGYVIRRILRRAVRYGYTYLNVREPFLYTLVDILAEGFLGVFNELTDQLIFIKKVIQEEENAFLRTLEAGINRFEKYKAVEMVVEGAFAFELFDTFGFPVDLTELLAREKGWALDMPVFDAELEKQRTRARNATAIEAGDWTIIQDGPVTGFIGYDSLISPSKILRYRRVEAKGKILYQLVLDITPFYAESGGQLGDQGWLKNSKEAIRIVDTKKENNLIIHLTETPPLFTDQVYTAAVDGGRRIAIATNHSATHLLQAALKKVLGSHIQQKGSLVDATHLRFDFSHSSKLSEEELAEVEKLVNEKVRENIALREQRNVPIDEAVAQGATALFGEKYGKEVRIITFGENYSKELCGGTHIAATGTIGFFKIVAEAGVATGIRRIEAITGSVAYDYIQEQNSILKQVRLLLKNPLDLVRAIEENQVTLQAMRKEIEKDLIEKAKAEKEQIRKLIDVNREISVVSYLLQLPSAEAMKSISFELKTEFSNLVLVLGTVIDGKPLLSIAVSDGLIIKQKINASQLIRQLAPMIDGGGGGQPFYATAGGKNIAGLQKAFEKASELF